MRLATVLLVSAVATACSLPAVAQAQSGLDEAGAWPALPAPGTTRSVVPVGCIRATPGWQNSSSVFDRNADHLRSKIGGDAQFIPDGCG